MEKREVTITITIDPDAKPGPSEASTNVKVPGKYWLKILPSPEGHPGTMAENLAHELGHIIGDIFETPAAKADQRSIEAARGRGGVVENTYSKLGFMPTAIKNSLVASEAEAWELGRKMIPIKQETIDRSLGTYKKIMTIDDAVARLASFSK